MGKLTPHVCQNAPKTIFVCAQIVLVILCCVGSCIAWCCYCALSGNNSEQSSWQQNQGIQRYSDDGTSGMAMQQYPNYNNAPTPTGHAPVTGQPVTGMIVSHPGQPIVSHPDVKVPPPAPGSQQWFKAIDAATGDAYWYNAKGDVTWDDPTGQPPPPPNRPPPAAGEGFQA